VEQDTFSWACELACRACERTSLDTVRGFQRPWLFPFFLIKSNEGHKKWDWVLLFFAALLMKKSFKKVESKVQGYVKLNGESEKNVKNSTTTPTLPFKQQQNILQSHFLLPIVSFFSSQFLFLMSYTVYRIVQLPFYRAVFKIIVFQNCSRNWV
jgi:hypothetical protein